MLILNADILTSSLELEAGEKIFEIEKNSMALSEVTSHWAHVALTYILYLIKQSLKIKYLI